MNEDFITASSKSASEAAGDHMSVEGADSTHLFVFKFALSA